MEVFYYLVFGALSAVVAGLELGKSGKDRVATPTAFNAFKNNYVLVYSLMMSGDWLQGPYVYYLYSQYGFDKGDIGRLFIAGFGSSMLFGTIVGSLADKQGRKRACITYCITYILSCITKHSPQYRVLMIGRILGGVATSLLFSAFESWLVAEHNKMDGSRCLSAGNIPQEETYGFSRRPMGLTRSFCGSDLVEEMKKRESLAYRRLVTLPPFLYYDPILPKSSPEYEEQCEGQSNATFFSALHRNDGPFTATAWGDRSSPARSSGLLRVPGELESMLRDESSTPHHIPLHDLKEITDNFSDERILGQGGFGVVYKGLLRNGKIIVVKKTVSSLMPGLQKQFESEVYHLMMLKHPNIVRCVGYCYETRNECLKYNGSYVFAEMAERLLCLEYLPNGSLDKYLSDESSGLNWSTRYNIIEGICLGLCHIHEKIENPIIHLDLKPANILLGDSLVPKITDFGLSRLFSQQQTICTSSCVGTLGYMAPEFLHGGIITPKSDIFSLGVIIMVIITGYRDYPGITRTSSDDFIELALEKWRNVLQRSPGYGSLEMDCHQIKRCIQVGLMCVNPDCTKRPSIAKIINMLQGSESID